jgi:O-antigen/teichoic acid export membrane protein
MKKKKIVYNFLVGILGQIITILLGLILPKFFITSFGSEVNGLVASVTQIYVYVNLLEAGVGTATLQALYKPIALNDKDEVNSILSATSIYYKKTGILYFLAVIFLSIIFPLVFFPR